MSVAYKDRPEPQRGVSASISTRKLGSTPIRVMLASTEEMILAGLERLFRAESNYEVVGLCRRRDSIRLTAGACRPDVLVAHVPQSDTEAVALLREIDGVAAPTRVMLVPAALVRGLRRAHASGRRPSGGGSQRVGDPRDG